jgi:5-deoxy-5-amino-3-dehydroquinate synthase
MTFRVALGDRSYDVLTGAGVRRSLPTVISSLAPRASSVAIITSESVQKIGWSDVDAGIPAVTVVVPDGDAAKTLQQAERVATDLSLHALSRHDVVVTVGGGAVSDLGGFVAASYLRGIAVVHLPTTLVGQVDAAIGGKTGVNLATGKNLFGAFHQPLAVLCDDDFLATLPPREVANGYGEVAKCCLLRQRPAASLSAVGVSALIHDAIALKADIVSADEKEGGARALLNYGHTLAHAIEALAIDGAELDIRHGEAVAIGLMFAARLAEALGRIDRAAVENHRATLEFFGLSGELPPRLSVDGLLDAMARDKKAHHDFTFVLDGVNGPEVVSGVPREVIYEQLLAAGGVK